MQPEITKKGLGTTEVESATKRSPVEVTAIGAGGGVSLKDTNAPAIAIKYWTIELRDSTYHQ